MNNLIMQKKGEHSWIRWIQKRIKNNLNFIALFQGPTGVGKTWAAISVSQLLDEDFGIDQIVFSFKELMDVINSDWFKKKKKKVIVFDEPQISISNRQWQSLTNKLMNYLTSTFRHQNIILFFATPYSDFLDSQTARLIHAVFECKGVNRKTEMSRLRGLIQQYNSSFKKTYTHFLFTVGGSTGAVPLEDWFISAPTASLIIQYEEKKQEFTTKLNIEISAKLESVSNKDKVETRVGVVLPPEARRPLTPLQERVMKCLAEGHNQKKAAEILNLTQGNVSTYYSYATKKGYYIKEFEKSPET